MRHMPHLKDLFAFVRACCFKVGSLRLLCTAILCVSSTVSGQIQISEHPELMLTVEQAWGVLGLNTAAHAQDRPGAPLQIGDRVFDKGLGHHASGTITVMLDGAFSTFESLVGLQPCGSGNGSVVFRVLVDGEQRFDSGVVRATDPARLVHVNVEGASELRLESHDAGDGIDCDMANWVNACLTPSDRPIASSDSPVDIVPFGRVVTFDPNRQDGTRASRIEEFPVEDFMLSTDLVPDRAGVYRVPVSSNNIACIGVEWLNRRAIKSMSIELLSGAALSATDRPRVQAWFGESLWQGKWHDLEGQIERDGNRLIFVVPVKSPSGNLLRTWKVRWLIPAAGNVVLSKAPVVYTRSRWATGVFRVELCKPSGTGAASHLPNRAAIEVIDGLLVAPEDGKLASVNPTAVTVRYAKPSALLSELTTLRIHRGKETTSVAVEDVLSKGVVYVPSSGVFVCSSDRPTTVQEYLRQMAEQKTVLERVRSMAEQKLEQAMSKTHHPAQNEGPVMLSLACDNAKVVVDRNGDLRWHTFPTSGSDWLGKAASMRVRLTSKEKTTQERRLDGGWLPVPVITTKSGPLTLVQRTFVAPTDAPESKPFRLNRPSVCVVQITLSNAAPAATNTDLRISFIANTGSNEPAEITPADVATCAWLVKDRQNIIGTVSCESGSIDLEADVSGGAIVFQGKLGPHANLSATVYLSLAGQPIPANASPAQLFAEVERYWNAAIDSATRIKTPEPFLDDVIRSSRVRCLIDARSEAEGERVAAWIAAMAYGPLESEAHSIIRGMDYLGHGDFARRSLDYFVHRYNTNGFLTTGYTTFGTGWHLWTLGEHWRLTHDTNWLRTNASEFARVGHWTLRQIEKTRRFTPTGAPVRGFGLMPPGVLADWNAFAQHFCMSAYYAAGLRELGNALAAIGHPDATLFSSASRQLADATLRAFEATAREAPVVPLRNGIWVPFYPAQAHTPGMVARSFPGEDAGRSWAYNVELGAHQMVPTGVLPYSSPKTTLMMEHMEDVSFLESGWFDYQATENERDWFNLGGFSKVQPYYCRNAEIYAMRDDVKPFLRSYFNSLASLLNQEVLTLWEHFNHSGAWDKTHETGYFLHQTRSMFVQERDNELWLAPFVPSRWLEDGKQVKIDNAPTFFGPVSYTVESHLSRGYVDVTIVPPTRNPPRQIVIRLRHPDSKPLLGFGLDGKRKQMSAKDESVIRLKSAEKPIKIRAFF